MLIVQCDSRWCPPILISINQPSGGARWVWHGARGQQNWFKQISVVQCGTPLAIRPRQYRQPGFRCVSWWSLGQRNLSKECGEYWRSPSGQITHWMALVNRKIAPEVGVGWQPRCVHATPCEPGSTVIPVKLSAKWSASLGKLRIWCDSLRLCDREGQRSKEDGMYCLLPRPITWGFFAQEYCDRFSTSPRPNALCQFCFLLHRSDLSGLRKTNAPGESWPLEQLRHDGETSGLASQIARLRKERFLFFFGYIFHGKIHFFRLFSDRLLVPHPPLSWIFWSSWKAREILAKGRNCCTASTSCLRRFSRPGQWNHHSEVRFSLYPKKPALKCAERAPSKWNQNVSQQRSD